MKDPVPVSFETYLNEQPPELQDEIIEDCQNAITLQYFDKNIKQNFITQDKNRCYTLSTS